MTDRAPYSRVYWSVMDDPKFDGIRESATHMGAWTLLLVVADMAWPAPAFPPPTVPRASYKALVAAGIVDELSGGRFRLHGLDKERGNRAESARNASAVRWQSERNAAASGIRMPSRDEHRQDETRRDDARENDPYRDDEGEALTWLAKHGCDVRPGNGYHRHLVTAVQAHGINAVVGMFDRLADAGMKSGDTKGYVFGAIDALNSKDRPSLKVVEQEDREAERASSHSKRLQATQIRIHENGGHFDAPSSGCPRCSEAKGAQA